jgi:aminoglycoside/choline kinase family phosphotransferase
MQRLQQLTEWLHSQFPDSSFDLAPASADASFRRYFRATFANGCGCDTLLTKSADCGSNRPAAPDETTSHSTRSPQNGNQVAGYPAPDGSTAPCRDCTRIVMDAPPQHENCRPFLHIGKLFEDAGAHVPHVYAQDLEQGFLLLSDLGNTTYLQALKENADTARELYSAATDALIRIQLASHENELPPYDEALLRRELNLFPEWYVARHLNYTLDEKQSAKLENVFQRIIQNNLAQPRVYVHRDYHSRNLMVTEPNPGILDFQDAVYGPITYDLASLFKDAYIRWEEEQIIDWLIRYWEKARKAGLPVHQDFADLYRDYEWMGVQRHIKVLGIFARLYHRDGKEGYLKDMPLVMDYLRRACARYIDLKPLLNLLDVLEQKKPEVRFTF